MLVETVFILKRGSDLKLKSREISFGHGKWDFRKFQFYLSHPEQNARHFADDMLNAFFVNEKFCVLIKMSLKFVPKGQIDNNPVFV